MRSSIPAQSRQQGPSNSGFTGHPTRNGGARLSSAELEEDVVTSLERLRTNFLDILLAHRDNEDLPVANVQPHSRILKSTLPNAPLSAYAGA